VKGKRKRKKEKVKSEKEKVENLKFKIHTFLQQRDYYLLEKELCVAFEKELCVAFENLRQHVYNIKKPLPIILTKVFL
jgi:hypothetical protein